MTNSHGHSTPPVAEVDLADLIPDDLDLSNLKNPASKYADIESPWGALGYVCLPVGADKRPAVGGWGATPWSGRGIVYSSGTRRAYPGGRHPTADEYQLYDAIALESGDEPRALLLPASGPVPLVVVDVDDPRCLGWASGNCGATQMTVTTGRHGGGVHRYYRAPSEREVGSVNGVVGPDESVRIRRDDARRIIQVSTPIDIKAAGGYVVAPGSTHKTGARYELRWNGQVMDPADLTIDMLRSLPVYDPTAEVERGKARATAIRARESNHGRAPRPAHASSGDHGSVDLSLTIVSAAGHAYPLADAPEGAYHSPFRTDRNPSCSVTVFGSRRLLTDWTTDERWWLDGPARTRSPDLRGCEDWVVPRAPAGSNQPPQPPETCIRSTAHAAREVYLPDGSLVTTPGRRLTCTAAPKGAGKTRRLDADVVAPALDAGGTVLAVTHRRTLSTILAERLSLTDYQDVEGALVPTPGAGHTVCLDSLGRCPTYRRLDPDAALSEVIDLEHTEVCLDEVVAVVRHMFGGTVARGAGVAATWRALREQLRNARHVSALDADLAESRHIVAILAGLVGVTTEDVEWVEHHIAETRSVQIHANVDAIVADMVAAVAERKSIWVYATTVADAEAIAERLRRSQPEAFGLLVSSRTVATPEVQRLLRNPNLAERYRWIVATPSCGTAWSYDGFHFDRRYLIAKGHIDGNTGAPAVTSHDCDQGLCRVRNPRENVDHVWAGGATSRLSSSAAELFKHFQVRDRRTAKQLGLRHCDADHDRVLMDYARVVAHNVEFGRHLHDQRPKCPIHQQALRKAKKAARAADRALSKRIDLQRAALERFEWAQQSRSDKEQAYRQGLVELAEAKYAAAEHEYERLSEVAAQLRSKADALEPEVQPGTLRQLYERRGIQVLEAVEVKPTNAHASIKAELKEREIVAIVNAADVTTDEADEIMEYDRPPEDLLERVKDHLAHQTPGVAPWHIGEPDAIKAAHHAAARRRIIDFYEAPASPTLVKRDRGGKRRSECRRYSEWRLAFEGRLDVVCDLDRREALRDPMACRHRLARVKIANKLLRAYGLHELVDGAAPNPVSDADAKLLGRLNRHAKIAHQISTWVPPDDPLRPLRLLLRSMGLRLKTTDGGLVVDGVAEISQDSAAYRERLLDEPVALPTDDELSKALDEAVAALAA